MRIAKHSTSIWGDVEWNQGASKISNMPRGLVEAPLASDLGEEILVSGHLIQDLEVGDRPRMRLTWSRWNAERIPGDSSETQWDSVNVRQNAGKNLSDIIERHWKGVRGRGRALGLESGPEILAV